MNTIKFTDDGRKVAVVGKLNSQETIVQEIFIINEAEIPSGENFVVKSLHDAPAISWKQAELKRLKEINERLVSNLESEKEQYEKQLNDRRNKFREQSKILTDKINFIGAALKNADESSFNAIVAFLEGRIKYLVKNDYDGPSIILFTQAVENKSTGEYWSGINLISIFGKDDGSLQFKVFDYYDGYKSSINVIPFETEEEAIYCVSNIIASAKEYNDNIITTAKKYNIPLDSDKLTAYKNHITENLYKNIESYKNNIANTQNKIEEINRLG